MALKAKITKAAFEALGEELQEHYKPDGDKHYQLDVTGIDTADALRRAKDRAEAETAELKEELAELNKNLEAAELKVSEAEKNVGKDVKDAKADRDKLQRKYDRDIVSKDEEISNLKKFTEKTLKTSRAELLAKEISTAPSLLAPRIEARLAITYEGAEPALAILDKDGNPDPKLTMDALKTELLANAELKPILIGSRATGSAGQKETPARQGATLPQNLDAIDPMSQSGTDFTARVAARRAAAGQTGP